MDTNTNNEELISLSGNTSGGIRACMDRLLRIMIDPANLVVELGPENPGIPEPDRHTFPQRSRRAACCRARSREALPHNCAELSDHRSI